MTSTTYPTQQPVWLSQTHIRQMIQADLPALEWDGEYAHFRRLYADIFRSASRGKAVLWVADLPGSGIIGQLFVQLNSGRPELADGARRAYIYGVRVKPSFRHHGVGTRLLLTAEIDLVERGFRWVTLNVARENTDARRLYEKLGYQVIAAEPGQWSYLDEKGQRKDVDEPAWRMEKKLFSRNERKK